MSPKVSAQLDKRNIGLGISVDDGREDIGIDNNVVAEYFYVTSSSSLV